MTEPGDMVPLDEALATVARVVAPMRLARETVPLARAAGRIAAEDQAARLDLPPFDKSAMDGYAIPAGAELDRYDVTGLTVRAGSAPGPPIGPGQAVKIMTGAAVPQGAARVVMVEHTRQADGAVTLLKHSADSNICRHGEDVRAGDVIIRAGTRLGPVDIGNLAACGITELSAAARVRLAVISTGDEIVDSPEQIRPGRIMNANGPMLAALGAESGLDVVSSAAVSDDLSAVVACLAEAMSAADIVAVSGGVSMGDYDFVGAALGELGLAVHFARVAVKPGKPMTFASSADKAVFALPGNPVSVYLMFHLFVLRAAEIMGGMDREPRRIALPLARGHARRKDRRDEYVPCRLTAEGTVEPLDYHGSAHLLALARADGFFIMPRGTRSVEAGQDVTFVPVGSRLP